METVQGMSSELLAQIREKVSLLESAAANITAYVMASLPMRLLVSDATSANSLSC